MSVIVSVCRIILLALVVGLVPVVCAGAEEEPSQAEAVLEEPDKGADVQPGLGSFSIFGSPDVLTELDEEDVLDVDYIEDLIGKLESGDDDGEGSEGGVDKRDWAYPLAPLLLYTSRHLFEKDDWSAEEIERGKAVAKFLALAFERPDLEITANDAEAFSEGLGRIKKWFAEVCQDNTTLAQMILTMDDGPFDGTEIDASSVAKMTEVDSVPIPDTKARIALLRGAGQDEPMVIAVLADDGTALSVRGLSAQPTGVLKDVSFVEEDVVEKLDEDVVEKLEGFGYKVSLLADWDFGKEYMHLYLDEALKVRFYFVSW